MGLSAISLGLLGVVGALLVVLVWLPLQMLTIYSAVVRARNPYLWALAALIFGPLALVVAVLPTNPQGQAELHPLKRTCGVELCIVGSLMIILCVLGSIYLVRTSFDSVHTYQAKAIHTTPEAAQETGTLWRRPSVPPSSVPTGEVPSGAPQSAQPASTPATESPDGVVRQYYADLNRRDGWAAQGKWHTPPPRLQDMVQQVDWFRVENISLLQSTDTTAQVTVAVLGKRLLQQPERWSGIIDMDKSAGEWKIVRMRVTPVAQHPDLHTGHTYVRQMISYAMAAGGIGDEEALIATKRRIEALRPQRLTDATARKRARADNARGLSFITNGQIAEAAQAFQAAYEADPTDVEIINNLGDAYQRLSNLQAAEPHLLRALVWAPGRANAWANLGHTYAKQGQERMAVACYANAYRFSKNQDTTRQLFHKWAVEEEPGVREAVQQALQLPFLHMAQN